MQHLDEEKGGSEKRKAAAAYGKDLGPRRLAPTRCFMFCPAATMSASMFTFFSLLNRNLLIPCHSLASALTEFSLGRWAPFGGQVCIHHRAAETTGVLFSSRLLATVSAINATMSCMVALG